MKHSHINPFIFFAIVLLFFISSCDNNSKDEKKEHLHDLVSYVDPNIGSVHSRWFFYTPASRPFGMAKLSPQTNAQGSIGSWMPNGYSGDQNSIEGFGHFHEFQIGGLIVMPTIGRLQTVNGNLENPDSGYRSRFKKENEYAEAGYYKVKLDDYNIDVELSATDRVGFHRYKFNEGDTANIIFDIGHKQGESGEIIETFVEWDGEFSVSGYIETYPEYQKFCDEGNTVKMYFYALLDKKAIESGAFVDENIENGVKTSKGKNNGLFLKFDLSKNKDIEMKVGLSYTSITNAKQNLKSEAESLSFDQAHEEARNAWNIELNKIYVEGNSREDKVKFYTSLYHALLGRGLASDYNGSYIKFDKSIGQIPLDENNKPKYNHYNSDGIWGAFWNLTQLWSLAYPEYLSYYVQSNLDYYKDRGWLHDGVAAGTYANGVQTNFQALVIASAYNCGIRDFDIEVAYEAALKNELEYRGRDLGNGKYDLAYFVKEGYIPYQDTIISNGWAFNFGASHTLEYSLSSYAVSQMASSLGKKDDARKLLKQAGYWENLYDSETKLIRPKLPSGDFIEEFDPMKAWDGFQEGNAYQYTWYVPHNISKLKNLIGEDLFNERLENTFIESQKNLFGGGDKVDSFSGVEMLYNHGNQPCLHNSWLFNYSNKPWLTQYWTRTICDEFYGTTELHGYGYGQDEDQGQLGAWFVISSMGLFDVQGLTNKNPSIQFSSPLFDKISIKLNNKYYKGDKIEIITNNNSKHNKYIQSVKINGNDYNRNWIERSKLTDGAKIIFEMGNKANKNWGIAQEPPSMD